MDNLLGFRPESRHRVKGVVRDRRCDLRYNEASARDMLTGLFELVKYLKDPCSKPTKHGKRECELSRVAVKAAVVRSQGV